MSAPAVKSNLIKKSPEVKSKALELGAIARFLRRKLKDYYLNLTREGEFLRFLAPKRGNSVYQEFYLKPKIREINRALKKFVKVIKKQNGLGKTNSLFITLTLDCEDREEAWGIIKDKASQFIDRLKKSLGKFYYVKVLEAHYSGRPHLHLILVLNDMIDFRYDYSKGRGFILRQEVYDLLKQKIDNCWGEGFTDIQAIGSSSEAISYVGKYAFKSSEIGTTLNKAQALVEALETLETGLDLVEGVPGEIETALEGLTETDIKKLYLHFYARQKHLRIFSTSRLKRLDNHYNNSEKVGGWFRVSEIDLPPELSKVAGKFTKLWFIRGSPDQIRAIGLIEKGKLITPLPEKGIIAHLHLICSFRDLTPDIPFRFLGQGEVAGLWLCEIKDSLK